MRMDRPTTRKTRAPSRVNGDDRTEIRILTIRLFGPDGQTGGVLGDLVHKVDAIEKKLDRWDGAITAVKVGAGFLTIGGIATLFRALIG